MSSGSGTTVRSLLLLSAVGLMGAAATYLVEGPVRFWANWLVWMVFGIAVGLGCLFIVALEHQVQSIWSVPLRRVPERLSSLALWVTPLVLAALLGLPVLYPWAKPAGASVPAIVLKSAWLNTPFFIVRTLICVALWFLAYGLVVKRSFEQDRSRDPMITVRLRRYAPLVLAIFALTLTTVAFDWISSLEPVWYSDIFGVYLFAGTFLSGLAATTLGTLYLYNRGRLPGITKDHLYNLGGFLFAFTVFWGYIAFAQYMLMWYGDMPEEVFWFKQRTTGGWLALALILGIGHFFVPFLALVSRKAKTNPKRLRWVSLWLLAFMLIDLYWLIFPAVGAKVRLGWPELSFALLFLPLGLLAARAAMAKGEDTPVGDPFLQEGLEFRL